MLGRDGETIVLEGYGLLLSFCEQYIPAGVFSPREREVKGRGEAKADFRATIQCVIGALDGHEDVVQFFFSCSPTPRV